MRSYPMLRRSSSANSGPNHSGCSYNTPKCGDANGMHLSPVSGTSMVAADRAAAAPTGTADFNCRAERVRSSPDGAAKARGPSPRDKCSLGNGAGMLCVVFDVRPCASLPDIIPQRAQAATARQFVFLTQISQETLLVDLVP